MNLLPMNGPITTKRFGGSFYPNQSELNKLWVHGLVHLFGYDHKKDKDFYKMRKMEKKLLSHLY